MTIKQLDKTEPLPYDLLYLADPSKAMIDSYIHQSFVFVMYAGTVAVGVYVLFPIDTATAEIKNIAVQEACQQKGIGKQLLDHAAGEARKKGFRTIQIATGNSSIGQLYLYQKQGFDIFNIEKDFFTTNYKEPIYENGIKCRHLIRLSKEL